jgi:hypothetical protein
LLQKLETIKEVELIKDILYLPPAEIKNLKTVIEDIKNPTWTKIIKGKAKKAWLSTKEKANEALKWTKQNKEKAAGAIALAGLAGGGYFFREGLSRGVTRSKELTKAAWDGVKNKGRSAWDYASRVPETIKNRFRNKIIIILIHRIEAD